MPDEGDGGAVVDVVEWEGRVRVQCSQVYQFLFYFACRTDMTFAADWALENNYLSILFVLYCSNGNLSQGRSSLS